LLRSMTAEVKTLVLEDNKNQTEALSYAASQAVSEIENYIRCINQFEQQGFLNRTVEHLPSEQALQDRQKIDQGLTAPEIAVVMAYMKIDIKHALLQSNIPDTDFFKEMIEKEFPHVLNHSYPEFMNAHPLRREIISTQLTNQLISQAGIIFVQRLREETNASIPQIVRAYAVIIKIFELPDLYQAIRALDFQVNQTTQTFMKKLVIRFLRRAVRWLIHHQLPTDDITTTLQSLQLIQPMTKKLTKFLSPRGRARYQQLIEGFISEHVPVELATTIAQTYYSYLLLEINTLAQTTSTPPVTIAKLYFQVGNTLNLDVLRDQLTNESVHNQWESLAHSSLRDKLDNLQSVIVGNALDHADHLTSWLKSATTQYEAFINIMQQLQRCNKTDYVMYSVVLNTLGQLAQQLAKQ